MIHKPDRSDTSPIPDTVSIYSQYYSSIQIFRDFFSRFPVTVQVNHIPDASTVYLFIFGDPQFVKSIFAMLPSSQSKRILIIHTDDASVFTDLQFAGERIVQVNSPHLTPADIRTIFSFLVTSSDRNLSIVSSKPESVSEGENNLSSQLKEEIPAQISRASPVIFHEEEKQIQSVINEIYGHVTSADIHANTQAFRKPIFRKRLFINALLFLILAPLGWYIITATSACLALAVFYFGFTRHMTVISDPAAGYARTVTTQIRTILNLTRSPHVPAVIRTALNDQDVFFSVISDLLEAEQQSKDITLSARELATLLLRQITGQQKQGQQTISVLNQLMTEIPSLTNRLGLAESQLHVLQTSNMKYIPSFPKILDTSTAKLAGLRETFDLMYDLLSLYKTIAGFDRKRTYLILFQNSQELRPTGGFIGTVAELTCEDGTAKDFAIHDVYELDGQLKGHVDPPVPFTEMIGQEHWFLRDVNWDPDFRSTAEKAIWFYHAETGKDADGVIALALPVFTDILRVTGPLAVPDYSDTITADNFAGKAFHYIQTGFFPGSTQKKDFIGSVANILFQNLMNDTSSDHVRSFLAVLKTALISHTLQFYFQQPDADRIVSINNWREVVGVPDACTAYEQQHIPCREDEIIPVEANLSVSKVNYFVSRQAGLDISVDESGLPRVSASFDFTNSASDNEPGWGGNYRNYMRLYLPVHARQIAVTYDSIAVAERLPSDGVPKNLPYWELLPDTAGHQIIGIALDVPAQSHHVVSVSYIHESVLERRGTHGRYILTWRSQPGVPEYPLEMTLTYPAALGISPANVPESPGSVAKSGMLRYNTAISHDVSYQFSYAD